MSTDQPGQPYKICPSTDPEALRKLNEQNTQFWLEQSKLNEKRMSDEVVLGLAMRDMDSEICRGVSVYLRKTFEQALADAENAKSIVHRELARRGGRAPKRGALQILIEEIVRDYPKITGRRLLHALKGNPGAGVISAIDGPSEDIAGVREIHFVDDDGTEKGVPLSGLKDRLFRAKKYSR